LGTALLPVGYLAAGWLAVAIGVRATLWVCAAVVVAATGPVFAVAEVRRRPAAERRAVPVG
jgi:hypothetical protein